MYKCVFVYKPVRIYVCRSLSLPVCVCINFSGSSFSFSFSLSHFFFFSFELSFVVKHVKDFLFKCSLWLSWEIWHIPSAFCFRYTFIHACIVYPTWQHVPRASRETLSLNTCPGCLEASAHLSLTLPSLFNLTFTRQVSACFCFFLLLFFLLFLYFWIFVCVFFKFFFIFFIYNYILFIIGIVTEVDEEGERASLINARKQPNFTPIWRLV